MRWDVFIFGTPYSFRTCAAQVPPTCAAQVPGLAQLKFPDLRSPSSQTCAAQLPEVAPRKSGTFNLSRFDLLRKIEQPEIGLILYPKHSAFCGI
jgi:hypothetical protein